jgi:hypothetical protein
MGRRDGQGSRGPATLADDAPAFTFSTATPDPLLLAHSERMFEAGRANRALGTDIFGWLCFLVTGWVEDHRIEAATGSVLTPGLLHGGGMVFPWMRDMPHLGTEEPGAAECVMFQ